ncbi:MAG: hypothetical protein NXI31_16445 [bacterium]|nr:hypothetical protein [bacterium]
MIALAAAVTAQDFVIPVGFGNASGPPASSYPVARVKDRNADGIITPDEMHAFCTTLPTQASSGTNFMVDGRYVWEDGNPVFYFCDSEDGQVIRGEDSNHNGEIDPSEATVFFRFGGSQSGGPLFSPDSLAVYRDTSMNPPETRVYVALDNGQPSSQGYTNGIHRLVDANGDGDASDPGEQSMFVDSSMGLTVPGLSGPVTISLDFWRTLRVLPGGKVIAFAKGLSIVGVPIPNTNPVQYTYPVQPEMNAWYGFTDNAGTASPEVWFNCSTLNDLPMHPDFDDPRSATTSLFPNWDVQDASTPATRVNWQRFCDVVAGGGPNGEDVYYLGSSYRTNAEGDNNINGDKVSGLIYRVVDADGDQEIDSGEINLFFNLSTRTYNGVAPIQIQNQSQSTVTSLSGQTWAFSTAPSGSVNFVWENGGSNDAIVSMFDANGNGVIEPTEVTMPFEAPLGPNGYLPPFSQQFGPYFTSLVGVGDLEMPGPFGDGIETVGDACPHTNGIKPLMETWNGIPQLGNLTFEIGCIRSLPNLPAFIMGDLRLRSTPLVLAPLLGQQCLSYLDNPVPIALTFGDNLGTHRFNAQFPNNPAYLGISLCYQMALLDPQVTTPVTYVVSNAMKLTIQP